MVIDTPRAGQIDTPRAGQKATTNFQRTLPLREVPVAPPAPRFRWTTLHRALDVLVLRCTNAEMRSIIEEVGCGPDLDATTRFDQTTPKYKNLPSKACRQTPPRLDAEGDLLANRLVREAASLLPNLSKPRPWNASRDTQHPTDAAFVRSLAVDGWFVREGTLAPHTPIQVEEVRSGLRSALERREANEALARLDQFERGLDEGHWESAKSDARGFLASVFDVIASEGLGSTERDGAARNALQNSGRFFRPDPRDPKKSLEGKFLASLFDMLGSEGVHTGATEPETAVYRYAVCVLTADHFLNRSSTMLGR